MITAVGRLEDERLQARELVYCRIEEPRLLEFDVTGNGDVVQAVADVEMGDRRTEDVPRVLKREAHIRGDVGGLPVFQWDRIRDRFPDVAGIVRGLAGFAHRHLDEIEL